MKLYTSLADWWPLLSPPADYAEDAASYWRIISTAARRPVRTMLELGCGGGNNALHLKRHARMTLSDLSPRMLAVSRAINPDCEHVEGDMRSLRLNRTFDAVFIHDAVLFMRTVGDLRAAMDTAYAHCAPGGVALFVPDCTAENWAATTDCGGADGEGRGLRFIEWTWDPDPSDTEYVADMVCALRDSTGEVRMEHDRHHLGVFGRSTWIRQMREAGFEPVAGGGFADERRYGEPMAGLRAGGAG
jgi:SAM-dependent methyltransferase